MFKKAMILMVLGSLWVSSALAEDMQPAAMAPENASPAAEDVSPAAADASSAAEVPNGNVSLDFRDADIANVLQILSYKSGVNIVVGPEVTGVVTIQLNDVPWKQALEVVLETYGYAYEQKGNIIMVTTVENLKQRRQNATTLAEQEPVETRTFTLNFGRASEIISSIQKMKSERGTINYDERTNTIIITDIAKRLDLMEGVIKKLDQTTPQVLIEAKIVETSFNDKENLGVDWLTKVTVNGAKRPITWPFTAVTANKYAKYDNFPGTDTTTTTSNTQYTYGTLDVTQFQAVLEVLKQKTDTNILSNPRIVTLDNQVAQIMVGSQYPIPEYTYNEEQGRLQVSGWSYKDIGIIFNVTPHINSAGFITLDVEPQITAIIGTVVVENTSLPELSNESTKTRVMIKDSETLVIAGLVKEQLSDTRKKLPIVGDVPVLGLLFSKKEKQSTKTDLMIFITPHIITPKVPEQSSSKSSSES